MQTCDIPWFLHSDFIECKIWCIKVSFICIAALAIVGCAVVSPPACLFAGFVFFIVSMIVTNENFIEYLKKF